MFLTHADAAAAALSIYLSYVSCSAYAVSASYAAYDIWKLPSEN